jgi:hypothetical protein
MKFERLSKKILPINYNLTLCPDLNGNKFSGIAIITIQVRLKTILFEF